MPRGGGGFRGGGFGGGGFRGGGFRGSSGSFRSGRVRSSGRPFGRTGSRRTVSRAPRTSSRHRSYYGRPYRRRFWGPYWRPWWRRPWHWYWWWGRPYRPWYYAPVYWTGGAALFIIALLIILPLIGLAFIPFPFTNASSSGIVTYRDTQTLYYNEYWYERETMTTGQTIEYSMQSQSEVTFIIWDQPFEAFQQNTKTLIGNYSESMVVEGDHDYQYIGYFLKPGSQLNYEFQVTSGGPIEFFVTDANDLNRWNNWETITPQDSYIGSESYSGSFTVPYAQDWYLVWYNSGLSSVNIDFSVAYQAEDVFDFSVADIVFENVDEVPSGTFTIPEDGSWYFFIYLDPFVNPAESVDITFDVSYNTEITYKQKWIDFQPILLFIGFIIAILLIIAIIQRRSAKKSTAAATPTSPTTPTTEVTATTPTAPKAGNCHRCNFNYKSGDTYCQNCGAKLLGRDYGTTKITSPVSAKKCVNCGTQIKPGSRFCKQCGAKIEQDKQTYEFFPDERKSFFCQLDNEQHPSTDSAYKCVQCSRQICGDCFNDISKTGLTACPYCKGELVKSQ